MWYLCTCFLSTPTTHVKSYPMACLQLRPGSTSFEFTTCNKRLPWELRLVQVLVPSIRSGWAAHVRKRSISQVPTTHKISRPPILRWKGGWVGLRNNRLVYTSTVRAIIVDTCILCYVPRSSNTYVTICQACSVFKNCEARLNPYRKPLFEGFPTIIWIYKETVRCISYRVSETKSHHLCSLVVLQCPAS